MKLEIVLGATRDQTALFATKAEMDGVDVQRSIDRFDELVMEGVRESYPDADISYDEGTRVYVTTETGATDDDDEGDYLQAIGTIADDILNRGDWIVMQGPEEWGDETLAYERGPR